MRNSVGKDELIEAIRANQNLLDMDTFGAVTPTCGTFRCIAGLALMIAGVPAVEDEYTSQDRDHGPVHYLRYHDRNGEEISPEYTARCLLGLKTTELFYVHTWPRHLRYMNDKATTPDLKAAVMIKAVEHFFEEEKPCVTV
jgi:hypothetical protein